MTSTPHISFKHVNPSKPDEFTTEASMIGLMPGEWPRHITTDLGNKQPFFRTKSHAEDGEVKWFEYYQHNGTMHLIVFND